MCTSSNITSERAPRCGGELRRAQAQLDEGALVRAVARALEGLDQPLDPLVIGRVDQIDQVAQAAAAS